MVYHQGSSSSKSAQRGASGRFHPIVISEGSGSNIKERKSKANYQSQEQIDLGAREMRLSLVSTRILAYLTKHPPLAALVDSPRAYLPTPY